MQRKSIPLLNSVSCPLCLSTAQKPIFIKNPVQNLNSFFQCQDCFGIYKNPIDILPEPEEQKRYMNHNNSLNDFGYLDYLQKSLTLFLSYANKTDSGLDYGCGPTKGIEYILKPYEYNIESYDKYFFNDDLKLNKTYDYIFCHEVIEHFVKTKEEIKKILKLLNPKGQIFIRTELYPEDLNLFDNWYYKNDHTHVFFFSLKTFKYIEQEFNCRIQTIDSNKFILRK